MKHNEYAIEDLLTFKMICWKGYLRVLERLKDFLM
jgi:hypothetical protein